MTDVEVGAPLGRRNRLGTALVCFVAFAPLAVLGITASRLDPAVELGLSRQADARLVGAVAYRPESLLNVTVSPTWGEPSEVLSPSESGTVTAVEMETGVAIVEGDVLYRVDAKIRRAHGGEPFYRPIGPGVSGPDVQILREFLVSAGFLDPSEIDGETFSASMRSAVRSMSEESSRFRTTWFDPNWTVWIPANFEVPIEIELQKGLQIAAGQRIAIAEAPLKTVRVAKETGEPILPDTAGLWTVVAGTEFLDGLTLPFPSESELAALASIFRAMPDRTSSLNLRLNRSDGPGGYLVPSTAIRTRADGTVCIVTASGSNDFQATAIDIAEGGPSGSVFVAAGLEGNEMVVENLGMVESLDDLCL